MTLNILDLLRARLTCLETCYTTASLCQLVNLHHRHKLCIELNALLLLCIQNECEIVSCISLHVCLEKHLSARPTRQCRGHQTLTQ